EIWDGENVHCTTFTALELHPGIQRYAAFGAAAGDVAGEVVAAGLALTGRIRWFRAGPVDAHGIACGWACWFAAAWRAARLMARWARMRKTKPAMANRNSPQKVLPMTAADSMKRLEGPPADEAVASQVVPFASVYE